MVEVPRPRHCANGSSVQRANGHGRENNPSGDLEAKGNGCEQEAEDGGGEETGHDSWCGSLSAETELLVGEFGAFGKEGCDELGGLCAHEAIGVIDQGGQEGNCDDFKDRVGGDKPKALAQFGNAHVHLDEHCSVKPTKNAEEGEGYQLEGVPGGRVGDLVEDELASAEGIERLEGDGCDHGTHE